jgi:cobalt transporter subunit CbtA
MFRRILTCALVAGFLGGIAISVVQTLTTTPLILHAETFEGKEAPAPHKHSSLDAHGNPLLILAHDAKPAPAGQAEPWAPGDGIERTLYTSLANVLAGIGFALILVACFALSGQDMSGRRGVVWGVAGFAAFSLAPALSLPPEVPGAMAAELAPRQAWWFLCVAATAAGLWTMVFRRGAAWMVAGIALLALPHLLGAPQPARMGGPVPPELAGHFAAASLVTAAIFWTVLGWLSGTVWQRLGART